jgi:hypothetical protein
MRRKIIGAAPNVGAEARMNRYALPQTRESATSWTR